MLASQWGLKDVMAVTSIAAALGLGRLISLPFAGPLSDKLGRRAISDHRMCFLCDIS